MPTPIRGQSITAPPKVDATLSNTSSNTVQNQAVANALAGAYDATATYAVGDLCIYDGILYECTTAITTAEAWDATHWKTGNFGEKVSDLNRQLSDIEENQIPELKNAISQLEDQVVTDVAVTGTDVTIVAQANKRYLCGTVSTIAVTPCATGAFDLIFTSGSSAAILTIPSTVKWQDSSFDPTALDTDTIYEISVADGTLGLVAKWT